MASLCPLLASTAGFSHTRRPTAHLSAAAGPAVFDALQERMGVAAAAVEQRALALAAEAACLPQRQEIQWAEKQE